MPFRTPAAIAMVGVLLTVTAGCTTSPGEPPDLLAEGPPPAGAFTASIARDADTLRIAYVFTNQSGADLVVANQIPVERPDPNVVYVTGAGQAGRVTIAKRVFARPSWGEAVSEPMVGGTIVATGHSVRENLAVPLPLTRRYPYGNLSPDGEIRLPDPITEVRFCLGVIRRGELPGPPQTGPTVLLPHEAGATAIQHLLCSEPSTDSRMWTVRARPADPAP